VTRLPPLNSLKAFDAAARRLSFTAAAQELHVTHGAVSRQITALEQHLGVPLFVRGTRGLRLTAEGEQLARTVATAFEMLRTAVEQVRPPAPASALRVSVPPTLAMRWLIPRMGALHEALPALRIELSTSTEPVDFGAGAYDAAIRRVARAPKGTVAVGFLDARPVPVCSPAYQKRLRLRSAADLARATLVMTRSEPDAWPDWLRRHKLELPKTPVLAFEQLYFAMQAALDSLGVALAPAALVQGEIEQGRLVAIAPPRGAVSPVYALVWRRGAARGETAARLGQWLRSQGDIEE
jgi:LysR family glycine cleavage system transcriptional activator